MLYNVQRVFETFLSCPSLWRTVLPLFWPETVMSWHRHNISRKAKSQTHFISGKVFWKDFVGFAPLPPRCDLIVLRPVHPLLHLIPKVGNMSHLQLKIVYWIESGADCERHEKWGSPRREDTKNVRKDCCDQRVMPSFVYMYTTYCNIYIYTQLVLTSSMQSPWLDAKLSLNDFVHVQDGKCPSSVSKTQTFSSEVKTSQSATNHTK